jgi:hypothetical protein
MTNVVVVVGAGAGPAFNFPTGEGLIGGLADSLNFGFHPQELNRWATGDEAIWQQIRNAHSGNSREYMAAGRELSAGIRHFRSVDDYLYSRGDDSKIVEVGKVGIAALINRWESGCRLRELDRNTGSRAQIIQEFGKTWLAKIFRHLVTGVLRADVQNVFSEIAFINFNYDRCVEQYLYWAVQAAFGVDGKTAAAMAKLEIIHPYGTIGPLPWQEHEGKPVGFGAKMDDINVVEMAEKISTFREQRKDIEQQEAMRRLLTSAGYNLFLGFGFHPQNMDIIALPAEVQERPRRVIGTSYEASDEDVGVFRNRINHALRRGHAYSDPNLLDIKCENLVDRFGLSIWQR